MKVGIPARINLFKFASQGLALSGNYKVEDFPRVSALVNNASAPLEVELNFNLENDKIPCIKGRIKLDVALTCQRCLDEVKIHLNPSFQLAFLQNEQQGKGLNPNFETILNADREFSSIEFITHEVLISIPTIPTHAYECASYKGIPEKIGQNQSPFVILKQIKRSK